MKVLSSLIVVAALLIIDYAVTSTVPLVRKRSIRLSTKVSSDIEVDSRPLATGKAKETKSMLSKEWELPQNIRDVRHQLTRFDKFVPTIGKQSNFQTFIKMRQYMFDVGVYPGVEYRITNVESISLEESACIEDMHPEAIEIARTVASNHDLKEDVLVSVRPIYPLIPQLERDWPVKVPLSTVPRVFSRGMYNTMAVIGSATFAAMFFATAFLLSQMITLR
jgi:hypothetical protein